MHKLRTEVLAMSGIWQSLEEHTDMIQQLFETIYNLCQVDKNASLAVMYSSSSAERPKRSTKEILKLVVLLMIEDVWNNFDSYEPAN